MFGELFGLGGEERVWSWVWDFEAVHLTMLDFSVARLWYIGIEMGIEFSLDAGFGLKICVGLLDLIDRLWATWKLIKTVAVAVTVQNDCALFADVDECKGEVYPCKDQQHCTNTPGSYKCYSKNSSPRSSARLAKCCFFLSNRMIPIRTATTFLQVRRINPNSSVVSNVRPCVGVGWPLADLAIPGFECSLVSESVSFVVLQNAVCTAMAASGRDRAAASSAPRTIRRRETSV